MAVTISVAEVKKKARAARNARLNASEGHLVYVVGRDRKQDIYKIGRTSNLYDRIASYERTIGPVSCLMQIWVPNKECAVQLEREFIERLKDGLVVRGREWFQINYWELRRFVDDVLADTSVEVLRVCGFPGLIKERPSDKTELAYEAIQDAHLMGQPNRPRF